MKFNAAVLVETGQPLPIIGDIEVPALLKGQVLVKLSYAGICHSQLMEASGKRGKDKYLPHLLGHEGTGEVVDKCPSVKKVQIGDKVVLGWLKGSGADVGGGTYQSPIGTINAGAVTTFNEYAVVSENRCYLLPKNISLKEGVLLGCALPTGMGIIKNQIPSSPNSYIAILGLGGIGMSALIAAAMTEQKKLIAIDSNASKLKLAKKLGADVCINPIKEDLNKSIAELTNGAMLDYVVEAAGRCETIELAFSLLNPKHGLCVFASHPEKGQLIKLDPHELICGKRIVGTWGGNANPEDLTQFVASNKDKLPISELLSETYPLDKINEAFSALESQKVMRAILSINN